MTGVISQIRFRFFHFSKRHTKFRRYQLFLIIILKMKNIVQQKDMSEVAQVGDFKPIEQYLRKLEEEKGEQYLHKLEEEKGRSFGELSQKPKDAKPRPSIFVQKEEIAVQTLYNINL
jgi:hypothetical protein